MANPTRENGPEEGQEKERNAQAISQGHVAQSVHHAITS